MSREEVPSFDFATYDTVYKVEQQMRLRALNCALEVGTVVIESQVHSLMIETRNLLERATGVRATKK